MADVAVSVSTTVVGFDSAWTDKPAAPGAVCVVRSTVTGRWSFVPPRLASFDHALTAVREERQGADRCLVAIDQPTIVPNLGGSRPVDKVAASLISFIGGGVQPANRSKIGMFDDHAPIWRFIAELNAIQDPELARASKAGFFLMEVFPALALPSLDPSFHARLAGARYNPARRNRYLHDHWRRVITCVETTGSGLEIAGIDAWCRRHIQIASPTKADQDLLDAVICALVGVYWLSQERSRSIVIGDLVNGYMVAPASDDVRSRLTRAAHAALVPVDGLTSVVH